MRGTYPNELEAWLHTRRSHIGDRFELGSPGACIHARAIKQAPQAAVTADQTWPKPPGVPGQANETTPR